MGATNEILAHLERLSFGLGIAILVAIGPTYVESEIPVWVNVLADGEPLMHWNRQAGQP